MLLFPFKNYEGFDSQHRFCSPLSSVVSDGSYSSLLQRKHEQSLGYCLVLACLSFFCLVFLSEGSDFAFLTALCCVEITADSMQERNEK